MAAEAGGAAEAAAATIPEFGLPAGPPPVGPPPLGPPPAALLPMIPMLETPRLVSPAEIDQFIIDNRLDEKAVQNLRAEPPNIQRAVIDRGSLAECLNPSSAVIGRIRDAKLQAKYGHSVAGGCGGTLGTPAFSSSAFSANATFDAFGIGGFGAGALPAPMGLMGFYGAQGQMPMMPMMPMMPPFMTTDAQGAHLHSAMVLGMPGAEPLRPGPTCEIELFIQANRVDTTAAQNLRAEPVHIQRAVLDRGSLAECVNPSSALIGRIRDAKLQAKYGTSSSSAAAGLRSGGGSASNYGALSGAIGENGERLVPPGPGEVEAFIVENRLDESAAQNLRAEPPQVQAVVIRRGSLAFCLNPSSALIGRIRDAKLQVKYGVPNGSSAARGIDSSAQGTAASGLHGGHSSSAVELFISDNRLDDGAARALRAEAVDVQAEVIGRGSLLACTNPSSAVMGRIREARLQRGGSGSLRRPANYGAMPPGTGDRLRSSPY